MNKRINACVLIAIALLFSTTSITSMGAVATQTPAANNDPIAPLLDLLGVRALIEQTPMILVAAIEAETQFQQVTPQPSSAASWRHDLEAQLKPQLLLQGVTTYLRDHSRADTFQRAQQRLQEPIAKRARYFDLAMTQPGAEKNLRDFLLQSKASLSEPPRAQSAHGDNATDERGSASRRALLQEIDMATASSLLTATLQSAIAARVRQTLGNGVIDEKVLADAIAERQRYLAPLAVDYLFYDYRYLRDDELRDYRDLLRDDAVRTLLDMSQQAVLAAIVGTRTPLPLTPPLNQPQ